MSKLEYKLKLLLSFPLNLVMLLAVRYLFGMEISVLVGIATIIATIKEFGYKWEEQSHAE